MGILKILNSPQKIMQERVNFMDKKEKEGGEPDIFCWIAVFNLAPEAIENSSSLSFT